MKTQKVSFSGNFLQEVVFFGNRLFFGPVRPPSRFVVYPLQEFDVCESRPCRDWILNFYEKDLFFRFFCQKVYFFWNRLFFGPVRPPSRFVVYPLQEFHVCESRPCRELIFKFLENDSKHIRKIQKPYREESKNISFRKPKTRIKYYCTPHIDLSKIWNPNGPGLLRTPGLFEIRSHLHPPSVVPRTGGSVPGPNYGPWGPYGTPRSLGGKIFFPPIT